MDSISTAGDLVTTKAKTVEGFKWQATEKVNVAKKYIDIANYFSEKSGVITSYDDIAADNKLFEFAIKSCFISTKSEGHLNSELKREIIKNNIDISKLSDSDKRDDYLNDLLMRYYLTCGDALGGSMRNLIGQTAQIKLTNKICAALKDKNSVEEKNGKGKVTSIRWADRQIIFDKKPKFINKSIDLILLQGSGDLDIENPDHYVACGELKGGIDPAGADEHFKTARAALDRVEQAFIEGAKKPPHLLFVGAAVENSMALEIFSFLQSGKYSLAANLTKDEQLNEFVQKMVTLEKKG